MRRFVVRCAFYSMVALLGVGLIACENEVDTTANALPETANDSGATNSDADTGTGDGSATACSCLQKGMWYRFNRLKITSIDKGPHTAMFALNPLWSNDIKHFELNFFVEVLSVSATEVKMRVINGARKVGTKDEVCLLPSTGATLTHPRAGCELKESSKSAMNVYAGTPAHPKNCTTKLPVHHAIPVRNAIMKSVITSDCSELISGRLVAGSFSKEALEKTCTCLTAGGKLAEECGEPDAKFADAENLCTGCNKNFTNLKVLLEGFGKLEYKCKSPSGGPAACLTAEFAGVRIDKAPTNCP